MLLESLNTSLSSIIIILSLRSRRLQIFSRHYDLWQGWLSHLLLSHFHHTLTHVGCRQGKRCVDVQVSFCHELIFWQVLPLGAKEYVQENLARWHFLTHWTRGSVLVMVYMMVWRHGLFVWYPAWSYCKRLERNWFCSPYLVTVPMTCSNRGEWSHRWCRISWLFAEMDNCGLL